MLNSLGLCFIWSNQNSIVQESRSRLMDKFKKRLKDCAYQNQLAAAAPLKSFPLFNEHCLPESMHPLFNGIKTKELLRNSAKLLLQAPGGMLIRTNDSKICSLCLVPIRINIFLHRIKHCHKLINKRKRFESETWFLQISNLHGESALKFLIGTKNIDHLKFLY